MVANVKRKRWEVRETDTPGKKKEAGVGAGKRKTAN